MSGIVSPSPTDDEFPQSIPYAPAAPAVVRLHGDREGLGESARYARTRYPILVLGQRGTGKTVLG